MVDGSLPFGARPVMTTAPRSSKTIYAPSTFRPVADVVDIQFGGEELMPCPGFDSPGTVYLVGVEEEVWQVGSHGGVVDACGRELGLRDAIKVMKRRGARLIRLVRRWLPDLERLHRDAVLRPVLAKEAA